MLIDDERKLINKLLNLSGLEINNYIKKLLNALDSYEREFIISQMRSNMTISIILVSVC